MHCCAVTSKKPVQIQSVARNTAGAVMKHTELAPKEHAAMRLN